MMKVRIQRVVGVAAVAAFGASLCVTSTGAAGPPVPQPAMGDPLPGLTPDQLTRFAVGAVSFDHDFTEVEGLGPIFNQTGCGSCHNNPLGGTGTITVTRAGREDKNGFDPLEDFGGSLFQQEAISDECREEVPASATIIINRVTNGMMGYGLVEAILDADLMVMHDPDDTNGDGVSGRAHIVQAFENPGVDRVGRFGWKAQLPSILSFNGDASREEMGITNPFIMTETDPNGMFPPNLGDPDFCDTVDDPEVGMTFLEELDDFQRFLAQPPQTPNSGMTGETLFVNVGCANCHAPSFNTADDPLLEDAIRNKVIKPYSDFLLHSMGLNGDGIPQGDATGRELKTPPLWGLVRRDPIWHDGRFGAGTFDSRVTAAILEHDEGTGLSEGENTVAAWNLLSPAEQGQLLDFLESLGRREFDADIDHVITIQDFVSLAACFGGGPYTPDDPCAVHDINRDGFVDQTDFDSFLLVYTGPLEDCNDNTFLDLQDILDGTSPDTDADGVPDECQCPFDLNLDGEIGGLDLTELLKSWGNPFNIVDLLNLLGAWGPCP